MMHKKKNCEGRFNEYEDYSSGYAKSINSPIRGAVLVQEAVAQ